MIVTECFNYYELSLLMIVDDSACSNKHWRNFMRWLQEEQNFLKKGKCREKNLADVNTNTNFGCRFCGDRTTFFFMQPQRVLGHQSHSFCLIIGTRFSNQLWLLSIRRVWLISQLTSRLLCTLIFIWDAKKIPPWRRCSKNATAKIVVTSSSSVPSSLQ